MKLLEENIGKTLSDINHSRILYDPPPRILEIKPRILIYGGDRTDPSAPGTWYEFTSQNTAKLHATVIS